MNAMKDIVIEKVTVNIGVGDGGKPLENARKLLEKLTGNKAVLTKAKVRNPSFHLKKGKEIGTKTTIRGQAAVEFLKKALVVKENKIAQRSFDAAGNFSFGVPEYIEFPGAKYDPEIGILGFDVCVTLARKGGKRVAIRRRKRAKIGKHHLISKEEGMQFAQEKLGVIVE